MEKQWKQWQTLFFWAPKSLQMVIVAMKLKDAYPKITADGDCSHEIKRCLLLGIKAVTNLDSILKRRDITLPTKARLVKAMIFAVVQM